MPYSKVTGIVTRYVDYKENDRILSIFTLERGRIDANARGCRRPKSPLLPAAQPFVYGEFELFVSKDRAAVNQVNIQEPFFPLREDAERFAAASSAMSSYAASSRPAPRTTYSANGPVSNDLSTSRFADEDYIPDFLKRQN